jgi:hypothetical protein
MNHIKNILMNKGFKFLEIRCKLIKQSYIK